MPNRILRDCCDSEAVNAVSVHAERLFYRLVQKADDYGRLPASPRVLRPMLFPLLLDHVREADLSRWLLELDEVRVPDQPAGLIRLYEVNGRAYLQIENFRQRSRPGGSKFPGPEGAAPNDGRVTDERPPDDGQPRDQSRSRSNAQALAQSRSVKADGDDPAEGDKLDAEINAYIRGHRFVQWSPTVHSSCRKLVEAVGWPAAKHYVDEAVTRGSKCPIRYAVGIAMNAEQKKGADQGKGLTPAAPRESARGTTILGRV